MIMTCDGANVKHDTKVFEGVHPDTWESADAYAKKARSYVFNIYRRDKKTGKLYHCGYGIPK